MHALTVCILSLCLEWRPCQINVAFTEFAAAKHARATTSDSTIRHNIVTVYSMVVFYSDSLAWKWEMPETD